MRTKLAIVIAAVSLLAMAVPVRAHHAFADQFDGSKGIKQQGTGTKMELNNQHAWIHVDVKTPDGTVTQWMVEAAAPNALLRRGWTKEDLLPGVVINVQGYQAKDGANRANGSIITFTNGKKLFVGSSNPNAVEYEDKGQKK